MASTEVTSPTERGSLQYFQRARSRWQCSPRKKLSPMPQTELKSPPPSLSMASLLPPQITDVTEKKKNNDVPSTKSVAERHVMAMMEKKALQKESIVASTATSDDGRAGIREASDAKPPPGIATKLFQIEPAVEDSKTVSKVNEKDDSYRERLVAFYKQHNPSKLDSVDATLAKFQGKEDELFEKLHTKYASSIPPPSGEGPSCFLEFELGRVQVKLFADKTPLAAENFRALCTGDKGMGRSNKPLCFRNCSMHRVVENFVIQGGDFTKGDGTGGESIYPPNSEHGDMWGKFKDETFMQHNRKGLLSMANNGANRNGSQFFITLAALPSLNEKHVVFGEVTSGMDVVEQISKLPTDKRQRPMERVLIRDCGEIRDGKDIRASDTVSEAGASSIGKPFGFTACKPTSFASLSSTETPFAAATSTPKSTAFSSTNTSNASPFSFSAAAQKPFNFGGAGATKPFSFAAAASTTTTTTKQPAPATFGFAAPETRPAVMNNEADDDDDSSKSSDSSNSTTPSDSDDEEEAPARSSGFSTSNFNASPSDTASAFSFSNDKAAPVKPFSFAAPTLKTKGNATEKANQSEASASKSSSAYPPLSSKAPAPFGGEKTAAAPSSTPAFGSGGSVPVFGSSSTLGGGFAALSTSPAAEKETGFGGSAFAASPFGAFAKDTSGTSPMVKPLFGVNVSNMPTAVVAEDEATVQKHTTQGNDTAPSVKSNDPAIDLDAPGAKKASHVFASFDEENTETVPLDVFEDMMDELGEGIHGDELDVQKALVDPDGTGKVSRTAFISWYVNLLTSVGSDDDSLDSEDRAEREAEKEDAEEQFASLATPGEGDRPAIKEEDFQELIEKFGTVYCEEEHRKTVKKLAKSDGMIYEDDFIAWYMKWLYCDDDDDEISDEGEDDEDLGVDDGAQGSSQGWGNIFGQNEGNTWKCDMCMVRNDANATTKCASCETPKPGTAGTEEAAATQETPAVASSSIGVGGFSFGGGSAAPGDFSFGSAPAAAAPKTENGPKPSGFSFGGGTTPVASGFSFGSSPAPPALTGDVSKPPSSAIGQGGFSFGASSKAPGAISMGGEPEQKSSKQDNEKTAPPVVAAKPTDANDLPGGKKAAGVFDSFDEKKEGTLPMDIFEDMLDELGEGIHGDELDAQKALVDPDGTNKLSRSAFISWYIKLLSSDGSDDDSLDSEDRAEREAEKNDAEEQFASLATPGEDGKPCIKKEDFQELIEKFGTVYCEEEHKKTIKKLAKPDGMIYEDDFIAWYMKWLYEDESLDEEEEAEDNEDASAGEEGQSSGGSGWGNIFDDQSGGDTWKCDMCMVRNDANATKCASCETPKPGETESEEATAAQETSAASTSSIGAGGFSFGGGSAPVAPTGFSFGSAPAAAAAPKFEDDSKPTGFSFAGGTKSAGGFSFTSSSATTGSSTDQAGFSFGGGPETKKDESESGSTSEHRTGPSSASKTGGSSGYPPMSSKPPVPFGSAKATAAAPAKSSGASAYPPLSSKPPVPFGGGNKASTSAPKPSGASSYPPMSMKPPAPFGGAKATTPVPKSGGEPAYPPLSTKPPVPFGGGKSNVKVTERNTSTESATETDSSCSDDNVGVSSGDADEMQANVKNTSSDTHTDKAKSGVEPSSTSTSRQTLSVSSQENPKTAVEPTAKEPPTNPFAGINFADKVKADPDQFHEISEVNSQSSTDATSAPRDAVVPAKPASAKNESKEKSSGSNLFVDFAAGKAVKAPTIDRTQDTKATYVFGGNVTAVGQPSVTSKLPTPDNPFKTFSITKSTSAPSSSTPFSFGNTAALAPTPVSTEDGSTSKQSDAKNNPEFSFGNTSASASSEPRDDQVPASTFSFASTAPAGEASTTFAFAQNSSKEPKSPVSSPSRFSGWFGSPKDKKD